MGALEYLANKKIYILVNIIILGIGYFFIYKGFLEIEDNPGFSNIYISIGTSLIAAGIVIFLDLWKNFSISKILERIKNLVNEAGVQWVYKKRDIDRYDDLMKRMDDSLDICGYSLGGFFDSFSEGLLEKISQKKLKVRVLFVEPSSEASKSRALVEGKTAELFQERFTSFIKYFKDYEGLEIRTIDIPLSTMIFRIDGNMFVGPHFYKKQSKSTLTMELQKGHWMFDEYLKEFDRMWQDGKKI